MKKTMAILFMAAVTLLIPCTACQAAENHNEVLTQENKENAINGGYTITDITDPVEVQSYIEQQGGEYTADIMAVHQVTFTDYTVNDITNPAEIKAYLESQGQEYNENITAIHQITFLDEEATQEVSPYEVGKNEYFVKELNKSPKTDYGDIIYQNIFPAGKVMISESTTLRSKVEANAGVDAQVLTGQLGFEVEGTVERTIAWEQTYAYRVKITAYPRYQVYTGELWENDPVLDDHIGDFEVWKAVGYDIVDSRG